MDFTGLLFYECLSCEAGEIHEVKGTSCQLVLHLFAQIRGGHTSLLLCWIPFWGLGSVRFRVETMAAKRGEQEDGVSGYANRGCVADAFWVTDLRVGGSEELLLISEVDLDVPPPEVGLDELFDRDFGVSSQNEGRFGVAPRPFLSAPEAHRRDDDDLKRFSFASLVPFSLGDMLVPQLRDRVTILDGEVVPGNSVISSQLVGGRQLLSVRAWAPSPTNRCRIGRRVQTGVASSPSDVSSSGRQLRNECGSGIVAIAANPDDPTGLCAHLVKVLT